MGLEKLFGVKPKNVQPNKGTKANKNNVKKTAQQTVPYHAAYANGIIEVEPGKFSRTFSISDVNFRTAAQEDQDALFEKFGELLNLVSDTQIEFTCVNGTMREEEFSSKHLLRMKNDQFNKYREEVNDILLGHLHRGNSIVSDKYMTLTIDAENIDAAVVQFERMTNAVIDGCRAVGGSEAIPLSFEKRMDIIYSSYHPLDTENKPDFDVKAMKQQGITSKDVVCPSAIKVNKDWMQFDDTFACTIFMNTFPSTLSTEFVASINEIPCHMLSSVHMDAIPQDKAIKLVRNQIVNITANIQDQQKKAARKGYASELISPDLAAARDEAMDLLDEVTTKNQRLFMTSFVVTLYARTQEELNQHIKTAQMIAQKYMCTFKKLSYQQEEGFASALPLGLNRVAVNRLLTTGTASLFLPYSALEFSHEGGLYYGLNSVSHSMILFNRLKSKNANGVILGTPGSGKSFSAKREMTSVLLGTDADVYVVDPEGEYAPMARMLGGEVVRIAAGSKTYINPLDMDMNYADDDDPVTLKADFLCSLCETAIKSRYGLDPIQKSIIDRCARQIYQPYLEYMRMHPDITSDYSQTPTLLTFYETLLAQPEPEAQNVALAIERFCTGSLDTFAHHTNVNINSRFVVYDIKDIGTGMKDIGLQVCLNDIWNRTIANKSKNKRTWFYLDEFYLLTQNESSALFLQQIFKRARKWGGVPTGITQNVEDLLQNKEARSILNNCDFVMMLNQSPIDRAELSNMFHISPSLQKYITNVSFGHGLLYTGSTTVPFIDEYPRDTESFKAMTTTMVDTQRND